MIIVLNHITRNVTTCPSKVTRYSLGSFDYALADKHN